MADNNDDGCAGTLVIAGAAIVAMSIGAMFGSEWGWLALGLTMLSVGLLGSIRIGQ